MRVRRTMRRGRRYRKTAYRRPRPNQAGRHATPKKGRHTERGRSAEWVAPPPCSWRVWPERTQRKGGKAALFLGGRARGCRAAPG